MRIKTMTTAFSALLMAVILLLPSCGKADAESVAKKIEENKELTQDDYGIMLDYITPAVEQMVNLIETGADEKKVEELNNKYPLADKFLPVLMKSESQFDNDNKKKAEHIAELYQKAFEAAMRQGGIGEMPAEPTPLDGHPAMDESAAPAPETPAESAK